VGSDRAPARGEMPMCHDPREHEGCGCAPRARHERILHHHYTPGDEFAGGFGIRRPLRFLAWKLGLSEPQLERFAAVINELKTERAQASVDDRRAAPPLPPAATAAAVRAAKAAGARRARR